MFGIVRHCVYNTQKMSVKVIWRSLRCIALIFLFSTIDQYANSNDSSLSLFFSSRQQGYYCSKIQSNISSIQRVAINKHSVDDDDESNQTNKWEKAWTKGLPSLKSSVYIESGAKWWFRVWRACAVLITHDKSNQSITWRTQTQLRILVEQRYRDICSLALPAYWVMVEDRVICIATLDCIYTSRL